MKVKYFITALLLSLFLTGCQVSVTDKINYTYEHQLDRYEVEDLVSRVISSGNIIYDASLLTPYRSPYIDGILSISYDLDEYQSSIYITGSSNTLWFKDPNYTTHSYANNLFYDYHMDTNSLEYHYNYRGSIKNSYVGWIYFETVRDFYGVNYYNPYYGSLKISNKNVTIYLDVVDAYYVNITLYDHYDNSYNMKFKTTWQRLGF